MINAMESYSHIDCEAERRAQFTQNESEDPMEAGNHYQNSNRVTIRV